VVTLPIVAPSPCTTCGGPCCHGRGVALTAFDLCRLVDALGVPWEELAQIGVAHSGGFRLDEGPTRWGLRLRQRDNGSCLFALDGAITRCAAHPARPSACRIYPLHVALGEDGGIAVALGNDAACPPAEAEVWSAHARSELVELEVAEHARWLDLVERWEATLDRARDIDELLDFVRAAP
jgi:Fe-S-cluster containining protein